MREGGARHLAHAAALLGVGRQFAHEAVVEAQGGHRLKSTGDNAGLRKDAAAVSTEPEPGAAPPSAAETSAAPAPDFAGRLRAAAALLEAVAADASLLEGLEPEERARF